MPHREEYTEFRPSEYPPFPGGEDFPTAPLEEISLQKLLDHDSFEEDRVLEACKGRGFFYLELAGPESGETILEGSADLCRVAEAFMSLEMDEKMKYTPRQKSLFGYVSYFDSIDNLNPAIADSMEQIQSPRLNRC